MSRPIVGDGNGFLAAWGRPPVEVVVWGKRRSPVGWSWGRDLNPCKADLQSAASPLGYPSDPGGLSNVSIKCFLNGQRNLEGDPRPFVGHELRPDRRP